MEKRLGSAPALLALLIGCGRASDPSPATVQKGAPPSTPVAAGPDESTASPADSAAPAERSAPRSRHFRFEYAADITDVPAGAEVRVWLPVPPSNDEQEVEMLDRELPAEPTIQTEPKFGNQILSFAAPVPASGPLPLKITYRVRRREARSLRPDSPRRDPSSASKRRLPALSPQQRQLLLQADARVPVGGEEPRKLLRNLKLAHEPLAMARQLYDRVDQHMTYKKEGTGWGQGDVLWACKSGYGNCTDFHSLFISLARAQGLPSRFEIGFPLPPQRGKGEVPGYHCWAMFYVDDVGWVPVDISEADKNPKLKDYYFGSLSEDRVAFSAGRDLVLVPPQAGEPLNFFVYPYVEVDGKPHPSQKIKTRFAYEDVEAGGNAA